jgi:hypothetical protein
VVKGGVDYCLLNLAGLMEMLVFGRNSSGGVSCDFKDFSNCQLCWCWLFNCDCGPEDVEMGLDGMVSYWFMRPILSDPTHQF